MSNRWAILTLLFSVRLAMAFQYQAVAALGPLVIRQYDATLVDLGLLIGLFLVPGIVFAIPGGGVARRFGDRRVVSTGLILMVAGGLVV